MVLDLLAGRRSNGSRNGRSAVIVTAVFAVFLAVVGVAPASASNHAWAWGRADWGQLGNGLPSVLEGSDSVGVPSGVCAVGTEGPCPDGPYLNEVTAISAGDADDLALLSNGTVVAWGENESGQLGDGTITGPDTCSFESRIEPGQILETRPCSATPVAVSGLAGVTAISAGDGYSLALLSNGTVMAWGQNGSGQLGDGNTSPYSDVPVAVSRLGKVVAIAAGGGFSLALLSNGTVMAWGQNGSGQLGDGNTSPHSDVPVPVSGLTDVTDISAAHAGAHSLAVLGDGAVMAWGANNEGQLGDGSVEASDVPVAVSGLSGVTAVSAGGSSSLALLTNGAVMAWGTNGSGQLGIGGRGVPGLPPGEELGFSDVPVQVCAVGVGSHELCRSGPFLSGASAISTGSAFDLALLGTGVVGWGDDCYWLDGFVCEIDDLPFIPEAVGGELGVAKLISAGDNTNLAVGPPLPTLSGLTPTVGLAEGGELVTITGTELSETTAVHFGSVSAPSFTVNSESSVTAVSPPETPGKVPVTVTTPAGTSTVESNTFFYALEPFPEPVIKTIKPKKGPAAGGTTVSLTGSYFFGAGVTVHFGSTSAASVTVNEPTTDPYLNSITAVSPPGTAGETYVTVTTLGGTSATSNRTVFKYEAPTVTGVSPNSGPKVGGTKVTITGTGFGPGTTATSFKFGPTLATSVNCTSTTTCTAVAPAHKAGTLDVTAVVGNLKSKKNRPADRFTYT